MFFFFKQKTAYEMRISDWSSDVCSSDLLIAAALREQYFPYICLNPGASYRHLHDSLVNFLGNERPQIVLCMHEEHAIGIAQGWGKIMDRPLAAAVHSNVGLMHASMGIFDAWCDQIGRASCRERVCKYV